MKAKEFKDLKNKDAKELRELLMAKKLELLTITGKIYAGKEKNLKKGKNLKRDIAQILTILSLEESMTKKEKQK